MEGFGPRTTFRWALFTYFVRPLFVYLFLEAGAIMLWGTRFKHAGFWLLETGSFWLLETGHWSLSPATYCSGYEAAGLLIQACWFQVTGHWSPVAGRVWRNPETKYTKKETKPSTKTETETKTKKMQRVFDTTSCSVIFGEEAYKEEDEVEHDNINGDE